MPYNNFFCYDYKHRMKRGLCFILALCFISISNTDAAVRTAPNNQRSIQTSSRSGTIGKTNVTRTATSTRTTARTASTKTVRTAKSSITSRIARTAATNISARNSALTSRAATTISTKTFDSGYNTCHDAYFTCMDQFCANQNDEYRRCVCSSRLSEIQSRKRALDDTNNSLQTFKNLNIDAINKSSDEVKAMITETNGETAATNAKDTSNAANTLAGISSILSKTKSKSLSTSGALDIGGDINEIWSTTELTSGANLANLTGEKLYNAVHSQCVDFVTTQCPSQSILNMVVSAYGMYIENDCALILRKLDKNKNSANSAIRETEREMNYARLESYNAHNSTPINDCISQVRSDLTQDSACGTDYVHCMDITGLYLNSITGEPIYTSKFYQLETQISLSGDILTNQQNRLIVSELNNKKTFAKNTLDKCRDVSSEVWNEFLIQAITEIYQAQQDKIRQVKEECLNVVNQCYDEQNAQLKDFSNIDENLLIGSRLEVSEEMCREKLTACSNLYGGGTEGQTALISAMQQITDTKIESACLTNLQNYVKNMCTVSATDTIHQYPYSCRTYAPGAYKDAINEGCNKYASSISTEAIGGETPDETQLNKLGSCTKIYTNCNDGYYKTNNYCYKCPTNCRKCSGYNTMTGKFECSECNETGMDVTNQCIWNTESEATAGCDPDYSDSLYQKLIRYASQVCIRSSTSGQTYTVPSTVMEDIVTVISAIKIDMSKELANECERQGGQWVSTPLKKDSTEKTLERFYSETSANTQWGYCIPLTK